MEDRCYDFSKIPLLALGFKTRDFLSRELDKFKVLPSPEGLPRDHRGLAQIIGITSYDAKNPTICVIALWSQSQPQPSFQDLIDSLGRLDRWDILDDAESLLHNDASNFSLKERQLCIQPSTSDEYDNIVTSDDARLAEMGLPPGQRYDAYLLYADRDEDIARNIVTTLEGPPYKLKLCLKDRDILPGAGFEHEAITYLISERCNKLIVVLTPNFINCPAEKFYYNFTLAIQLSERSKKIIPCIFKLSNDIAANQKLFKITYSAFAVNFTKPNPFRNNWDKLRDAISISLSSQGNCLPAIESGTTRALEYFCVKKKEQSPNNFHVKISKISSPEEPCTPESKACAETPFQSSSKIPCDSSIYNGSLTNSKQSASDCSSANSTAQLLKLPKTKHSALTKVAKSFKNMKILPKKKKKSKSAVPLHS